MLNGLTWMPKVRRKRFSYRHQTAKLIALGILEAAPKVLLSPLHTPTAHHRLRRRLKANFLALGSRTPLLYRLTHASISVHAQQSGAYMHPTGGVFHSRRSPVVPLRYAPSYTYASMLGRPIRSSLRLFYLVLATPTYAATGSARLTQRWVVMPRGAFSKAPFGSM